MYALVLLTALAGPGQPVPPCSFGGPWLGLGVGPGGGPFFGPGGYPWFGPGGYAHGYGSFWPLKTDAGGVVLPPSWSSDTTTWCEWKAWFDYVMLLDGREREEMLRVWERATPEARKLLLCRLRATAAEAALTSARILEERARERYRVENRPLTEEEAAVFENYYLRLRGLERKAARDRWLDTDNRGRRIYLKEIIRELELQERAREDKRDFEEEIELQKERKEKEEAERKEKEAKEKKEKDKKDKEDKAKKDKEKKDKDKKDKEDKAKKDKEDKDKKDEDK